MIQDDAISFGLTILALALLLFLAVFGTDLLINSIFIAILIIASFPLMRLDKTERFDEDISGAEFKEMIIWVFTSLAAIILLGLFLPAQLGISELLANLEPSEKAVVMRMYGVLIAVGEERYFRGFFANFFIKRVGPAFGSILSGALFGVYHLARYGNIPGLLLVATGAGIVLTYAAWRTQRLSTPMIAHVINNALAVV